MVRMRGLEEAFAASCPSTGVQTFGCVVAKRRARNFLTTESKQLDETQGFGPFDQVVFQFPQHQDRVTSCAAFLRVSTPVLAYDSDPVHVLELSALGYESPSWMYNVFVLRIGTSTKAT